MAEWAEFERAPPDLHRWYLDRRYTKAQQVVDAAAAVEVEVETGLETGAGFEVGADREQVGLGQVVEHVEPE